jgi:hypothetical protein
VADIVANNAALTVANIAASLRTLLARSPA